MNDWLVVEVEGERGIGGDIEDEDFKKVFDEWKLKFYVLIVLFWIVGF